MRLPQTLHAFTRRAILSGRDVKENESILANGRDYIQAESRVQVLEFGGRVVKGVTRQPGASTEPTTADAEHAHRARSERKPRGGLKLSSGKASNLGRPVAIEPPSTPVRER